MRSYNFSAGPSSLPLPVLQRLQEEIFNYAKGKYWVAEISHRSKEFINLAKDCQEKLRLVLAIPKNYEILFLHGGITWQYPLLPLNFLSASEKGGYFITGHWSKSAFKFAHSQQVFALDYCEDFSTIPNLVIPSSLGYLYVCDNETVNGVEFRQLPSCKQIILDITSNVFTKRLDFASLGIAIFSAQKNIGVSGLGIMIVREDFLEKSKQKTHLSPIFNYYELWQHDSMLNTPNTFAIYVASLVLDWMIAKGGVEYFERLSKEKSALLYQAIDTSQIYSNKVEKKYRSRVNVPFTCKTIRQNELFLQQAAKENLLFLKGHRAIGGIRASMYNAMDLEGVKTLVDFMQNFENHCI